MSRKIVDLTGHRFGRLLVTERIPEFGKNTKYKCICDCGNYIIIRYNNLGRTTNSCGCLKVEACKRKKMPDDKLRVNEIVRYYRRNAKIRLVDWGLSKQQFEILIKQPCKYCGYFDPKLFSGIDRVDNSLGYTSENSVPCCRWCNWGKNERTVEEFKDWVERLYERRDLFHSR